MRKDIIKKILAEYKEYKMSESMIAEEIYRSALNDPDFASADERIRKLSFTLARQEAYDEDSSSTLKELTKAKKDYQTALKKLGLKESDFQPKYRCKFCKDTGYEENGKLCKCVKQKLIDNLKASCGMSGALDFRFCDNTLSIFEGTKQEKSMVGLYNTMQAFCEKFPQTKYKNILLSGPTGIGKSYLISAVANDLMEKGFSVLYVTAFEFNDLVLKYHTTPISERNEYMDDLLSADLLIIDDLGTEPIRKNVSVDYLYSVISYRMEHAKHTVFSTNLDATNLLSRYGERVFSRLFHKKYTYAKRINGDDLRLKK